MLLREAYCSKSGHEYGSRARSRMLECAMFGESLSGSSFMGPRSSEAMLVTKPTSSLPFTLKSPTSTARAFSGLVFDYSGGHFFGGGAAGHALSDDQLAAFNPDFWKL